MSGVTPDYLDAGEQERPSSIFSDLSSEPDRLYIDLDGFDGLAADASERAAPTPQPIWSTLRKSNEYSHSHEAAVDCRLSRPWFNDNDAHSTSTPQLFRPFSPALPTPEHDYYRSAPHSVTGFCAPQLNHTQHTTTPFGSYWYSQPAPYTRNYVPPQPLTPDAEVSMYSWMARDSHSTDLRPVSSRSTATPTSISTSGTSTPIDLYNWMTHSPSDSDSRPGSSSRDTATPSSISTSGTATPVDLDSREPHLSHSYPPDENQPIREPYKWKAPGKAAKRKDSGSGSSRSGLPYKRYSKPPYTYCGLITTAIQMSPRRKLTLADVNQQLTKMFEFFRGPYEGWKQSVRHNLSHSPCFVKVERAEDGVEDGENRTAFYLREDFTRMLLLFPCFVKADRAEDGVEDGEKRTVFYWRVDFTRMTHGAFCLQRTVEGRTGDYKNHIHEHLDLDPSSLYGHDIAPFCRCRRLSFPFPRAAETDKTTGEGGATTLPITQLRLPVKTGCVLPTDSPEAYGTRDVANAANSSLNSSFIDAGNQSASPSNGTGSCNQSTHAGTSSAYHNISQYILATDGSDLTSTAAENLSFLCFNKTAA